MFQGLTCDRFSNKENHIKLWLEHDDSIFTLEKKNTNWQVLSELCGRKYEY